jgi:hypothetical protein
METKLHKVLKDCIIDEIKYQLRNLTKEPEYQALSNYISAIKSAGHARVKFEPGVKARKSPDHRFDYIGIAKPQFVLEVVSSQSQKRGALQYLAKDYYERSDGKIKTVLTVTVKYRSPDKRRSSTNTGGHSASFSLYRGPQQVHKNRLIREASGELAVDGGLELFLSDFIPDAVLCQLSRPLREQARATAINIPADQMYKYVILPENAQAVEDEDEWDKEQAQQHGTWRSSKKRKLTVHWDVDVDEESEESPPSSASSVESAPRSKRRKTGSADEREYQPPARTSASLPDINKRQTRSMSRGKKRV